MGLEQSLGLVGLRCLPKVLGGLGVKQLDLFNFNLRLLGKWRWCFLVDKDACSYSLIVSRYGAANLNFEAGIWNSWNSSQWWRDISALDYDNAAPVKLVL